MRLMNERKHVAHRRDSSRACIMCNMFNVERIDMDRALIYSTYRVTCSPRVRAARIEHSRGYSRTYSLQLHEGFTASEAPLARTHSLRFVESVCNGTPAQLRPPAGPQERSPRDGRSSGIIV